MRYLKFFREILETITTYSKYNNWNIRFNHSRSHDLDDKIKRTGLSEKDFPSILERITKSCEIDNLDGDWVFISFTYECKVITRVLKKNDTLYIITFLGKDEDIKKTKNIKLI